MAKGVERNSCGQFGPRPCWFSAIQLLFTHFGRITESQRAYRTAKNEYVPLGTAASEWLGLQKCKITFPSSSRVCVKGKPLIQFVWTGNHISTFATNGHSFFRPPANRRTRHTQKLRYSWPTAKFGRFARQDLP